MQAAKCRTLFLSFSQTHTEGERERRTVYRLETLSFYFKTRAIPLLPSPHPPRRSKAGKHSLHCRTYLLSCQTTITIWRFKFVCCLSSVGGAELASSRRKIFLNLLVSEMGKSATANRLQRKPFRFWKTFQCEILHWLNWCWLWANQHRKDLCLRGGWEEGWIQSQRFVPGKEDTCSFANLLNFEVLERFQEKSRFCIVALHFFFSFFSFTFSLGLESHL